MSYEQKRPFKNMWSSKTLKRVPISGRKARRKQIIELYFQIKMGCNMKLERKQKLQNE